MAVKVRRGVGVDVRALKIADKSKPTERALISNVREIEDEFTSFYGPSGELAPLIPPRFNPAQLADLVFESNSLSACIDAMVTNIDGTGFVIEPREEAGRDTTTSEEPDALPKPDAKIPAGFPPKKPGAPGSEEEGKPGADENPDKLKDRVADDADPEEMDPADAEDPNRSPDEFARRRRPKKADAKVVPFRRAGQPDPDEEEDPDADPDAGDEDLPEEQPEDLTGEFEDGLGPEENDPKLEALKDFFAETFPGESFVTVRRKRRWDLEATGNAYLEVIRDPAGKVVFLRHIDAKTMRLVKLGPPLPVEREVRRDGRLQKFTVFLRERRYAQKIGEKLVYFREFGSSKDIDKETGGWAAEGVEIPADRKGTEIIHTTLVRDPNSPYGLPRWISQVPSVLGSRKAEVQNLDYFDAGGLPPILIVVSGGQLARSTADAAERKLTQRGSARHVAQVLEAYSTSGGLDQTGTVKVDVHRFGAEKMSDSMFENYDAKCEARVRSAFRLPALFVGRTDSYTYATAFASYTVAEAQVFAPERTTFDELMNLLVLPALDARDYEFRSLPLAVKDSTLMLQAIQIAMTGGMVSGEDIVEALNEVTNLNLPFDAEAEAQAQAQAQAQAEAMAAMGGQIPPGGQPPPGEEVAPEEGAVKPGFPPAKAGPPKPGFPPAKAGPPKAGPPNFKPRRPLGAAGASKAYKARVRKIGLPGWVLELATDATSAMRRGDLGRASAICERVRRLPKAERILFDELLAIKTYSSLTTVTPEDAELAGCTAEILLSGRR